MYFTLQTGFESLQAPDFTRQGCLAYRFAAPPTKGAGGASLRAYFAKQSRIVLRGGDRYAGMRPPRDDTMHDWTRHAEK